MIDLRLFLKALLVWVALFRPWALAQADPLLVHHDLRISLFPAEQKLVGVDELTIPPAGVARLAFFLSGKCKVLDVEIHDQRRAFQFKDSELSVPIDPGEEEDELRVRIRYEGVFADPVPTSPMNLDNPGFGVTGVISDKGTFLQAGAGWYPELPGAKATYLVRIDAPLGMVAVTAGRSLGHENRDGRTLSTWEVKHPVEGLALSAANYLVQETPVGRIVAATYFLAGNASLSQDYLDAITRYLSLYEGLFGPYPFDKFAVVENFFPTGYGFPSYTLLGGTVIRLPFILRTSLGHEIAHCWWGNGVQVDPGLGNWSEGLTTYVSDYLFKEKESDAEAFAYRHQFLRNYAALVTPDDDFPLSRFKERSDPVTKAVGYDKGAMVFHMVRRLIGEEAFWSALRDVYRDKLFQRASWPDFQSAFEKRGNRSLDRFFAQWVSRAGAPELALDGVTRQKVSAGWEVRGRIVQKKPVYDLEARLSLEGDQKDIEQKSLPLAGSETPFTMLCKTCPRVLRLDPDCDLFRRLSPSEIPSSVNAIKGSTSLLVLLSGEPGSGLQEIAEMLAVSLGVKRFRIRTEETVPETELRENDILWIGLPKGKQLPAKVPEDVILAEKVFTLNGRSYDDPSDVFFGVFAHPSAANRCLAVFLPLSVEGARTAAAKITHYGKYSYLSFRGGENTDKGNWPILGSPLVFRWPDCGLAP